MLIPNFERIKNDFIRYVLAYKNISAIIEIGGKNLQACPSKRRSQAMAFISEYATLFYLRHLAVNYKSDFQLLVSL